MYEDRNTRVVLATILKELQWAASGVELTLVATHIPYKWLRDSMAGDCEQG